MRTGIFAFLTALLIGTSIARAQDSSVYVNLSALDALNADVTVESEVAPLFPVVKAAPKQLKKPVSRRPSAKKSEPKIEVKVIEPVVVEAQPKAETIPYVETKEEVVVVDVEPVVAPAPAPVVPAQPAAEQIVEQVEAPVAETAPVVVPVPVETPAPLETPAQGLLLEPAADAANVAGVIRFAEEESTLTDAQKTEIDQTLASFTDATNNKIAIYSYSLDDGVDSFRKKRISLNRAVEIRSYLLQKGYKNFSIKVLNSDNASNKINTVELEELK